MKSKHTVLVRTAALVIIALTLIIVGCAKPPTTEMNNAVEAVTRAENDPDAVMYASGTLARAKDALNRMQTEANSKRYDAAKNYAAEAIKAAEQAQADGRAGATQARNDAAALLAGLRPAIAETEQGIRSAEAAGLSLDFDALDQDFNAVQLSADQAEVALSSGEYQDAMAKCRDAQAGLSDINRKLSEAVMVTSRKK